MGEIGNRRLLIIAGAMIMAVIAGWNIAEQNLMTVMLVAGAVALWIAARNLPPHADALVGGIVAIGYLVGNRGFAQIHPSVLPLLPGEATLGLAFVLVGWRAAGAKTLPIRYDALNMTILAWIAVGVARTPFDFREFGIVAVRDFAIVYYALFFFIAQAWADTPADRRWLLLSLTIGLALSGPVLIAFSRFPDWFIEHLLVGDTPLVFVKSDVAAGFMAGAVLWFAHRCACSGRRGWLVVSAIAFVGVFESNSRAAVVALFVGVAWVLVLRAWKILRFIIALAAVGFAALVVQAIVVRRPLVRTPLYRLYESAESMVDVSGTKVYRTADLSDKPDNNQFRLVWWRSVVDQTWSEGRWFGLGFGHDLAEDFFRVYYADVDADFNVRSPHNFLLSVFGRMGLIGLGLFSVIIALMARQTWRARGTRDDRDSPLPLWLTGWTILASACFGVVLEGPMAAMVFWTALGLANATSARGEPSVALRESIESVQLTGRR